MGVRECKQGATQAITDSPHSCGTLEALPLPPSEIPPKTTTLPLKSTMPAPCLPSGSSWPMLKNWFAGASNLPLEAAMVGAKRNVKNSPTSIAWRFIVPVDRSITIQKARHDSRLATCWAPTQLPPRACFLCLWVKSSTCKR